MFATKGYATHGADQPLKPFSFDRRDPTPRDVQIDIHARYRRCRLLSSSSFAYDHFFATVAALIPIVCISILALATAKAQDPVKVDPAHYKVLFDNEQVRIMDVRHKPGEKTPMQLVTQPPATDNVWDVDCSTFFPNEIGSEAIHGEYFNNDGTIGLMRKILRGIDREVLKATKATQGTAWQPT